MSSNIDILMVMITVYFIYQIMDKIIIAFVSNRNYGRGFDRGLSTAADYFRSANKKLSVYQTNNDSSIQFIVHRKGDIK